MRYAPELSRGQQAFAFFSFACLDRVLKSKPNKNNLRYFWDSVSVCVRIYYNHEVFECNFRILGFIFISRFLESLCILTHRKALLPLLVKVNPLLKEPFI